MLKFVQQHYRPGERMAVFTLTGQLRVLQDFTSDPQILYTALQRFRPVQQEFTDPSAAALQNVGGPSSTGARDLCRGRSSFWTRSESPTYVVRPEQHRSNLGRIAWT